MTEANAVLSSLGVFLESFPPSQMLTGYHMRPPSWLASWLNQCVPQKARTHHCCIYLQSPHELMDDGYMWWTGP